MYRAPYAEVLQFRCILCTMTIKGNSMYGLDNIWKSGIWGCKKNRNIEKIIFKVVQMKYLAMYNTN